MKRFENFNNNSASKKPKIQNDDNFWDEDLDIQEVDECLTQIETQSTNLNSTCYDNFKINANQCSTQAFLMPNVPSSSSSKNFNFRPQKNFSQVSSTSSVSTIITNNVTPQEFQKKLMEDIKKLEEQNKKLTEQYKTKDGEISILRMQLKQTSKQVDTEKMQKMQQIQKTQQEWSEKYNAIVKEKDNVKNELDLKQLEVINLREKLRDLKFQNNTTAFVNNISTLNNSSIHDYKRGPSSTHVSVGKKVCSVQTDNLNTNCALSASPISFPLQQLIPNIFFDKQVQQHLEIMTLHNSNSRTLKTDSTQYENVIDFQAIEMSKGTTTISTENFYTELIALMNYTKIELDSEKATPHVIQIVFITKHLFNNAMLKLRKIEENISNEDIRHMNEQYLYGNLEKYDKNQNYCVFSGCCWSEDELLVDLRRSIAVLAVIIPYNTFLVQLLTNRLHKNNLTAPNTITQIIDSVNKNEEKCNILNKIYEAVKIIGKIRRAHQFSGFLSSVLLFITNLIKNSNDLSTNCCDILHLIFQQIVFSRPSSPVLKYIAIFLRNASSCSYFLTLLCKNSKETSYRKSKMNINFTQETCTFQVLIVLLERNRQSISFVYDVFSFLNNALRTNTTWFHSQETIRCSCVCLFCITATKLLFKLMLEFKENLKILNSSDLKIYSSLFEIGLNVLNILSHRCIDAILENFQTHSQSLILITNMAELNKHLNYNSNQEIIQEHLLSSELSEEEIFKDDEPQDLQKINSIKL